jgi:hypothetical protein
MAVRILTALLTLALGAVSVAAQTPRQVKTRSATTAANRVPSLTLEVGAVIPVVEGVKRASGATVCAGDKVSFRAAISDPNHQPMHYAWLSTGGRIIGEGAEVVLDTTDLPPGDYHITAVALYPARAECSGNCMAYDTKTIRISPCPPLVICFTSPVLALTPDTRTVQTGEAVTFVTPGVSGGQGYGQVTYVWQSSAGEISGNGTTARLDTTGVAPETVIEVSVTALTEVENCSAKGAARVILAKPPTPPRIQELTPCATFKRHDSRVDNACKYVLTDAARALQAEAQARLVVDAFHSPQETEAVARARGKNVRDRLADGSLGLALDAHRIIVRMGGVASDGSQIRLYFVPAGGALPLGPPELKLGPVEVEKKSAPHGRASRSEAGGATRR